MKIKDSEKIALLLLLGFGVLGLSFMYIAKPQYEEMQKLEAESVQLQTRLSELQAKAADRQMYEEKTVEYTEQYEEILNAFPADLNQEITIMFLQGIKDSNDFTIESVGLGESSPFYTLGASGADASLTTEESTTITETTDSTELPEGTEEVVDETLTCYKARFPISYSGTYTSLKDVVTYIDNFSDRMTVDTLSISYSGEDEYTGSLDLSCYSVEGPSRPERTLELEQVEIGVDNIFEGGEGASNSSDASLNKYNENDGLEIESSYDFYTMLNASTSDVSAKILGQNGTGKEATVISNNDNTISEITYDFYEVDGKVYCKYTLDGSMTYEAEVTSAEDVKVLIQSSERKNDDDKVAVKVTVRNSTNLPVYVKVSGDDAVSPRVTVSKSGLIKVYQ